MGIYGSASGTSQLGFFFGQQGTFEGSAGASSGRQNYWFDNTSSTILGGFGSSNFHIGPSGSVYGLKVARLTSGTGITINTSGSVGIGTTSITAKLHLPAGTATASTAPIKLTSGSLNTTAEVGTIEYNNTFHVTNSDATRRHIATAPNATKVTAAAPYTNDGYILINIGGTDFKVMTTV